MSKVDFSMANRTTALDRPITRRSLLLVGGVASSASVGRGASLSAPFSGNRVRAVAFDAFVIFDADGDAVITLFAAAATAADGLLYRNTYTWYFFMRDGKVAKTIAFFATREFDEFWHRVQPK